MKGAVMHANPSRITNSAAVIIAGSSLVVFLCLLFSVQPALAEITWSGDVDPEDPTSWTASTYARIGCNGDGEVKILDGEVYSACTSIGASFSGIGSATVSGIDSTWTINVEGSDDYPSYIGDTSNGMLTIEDGGTVNSGYCFIGYSYRSVGTVIVNGNGSTWTNTSILRIGWEGRGTLSITDGGHVSNVSGVIGFHSTGEVIVSGTGSKWTNSSNLRVGFGYSHSELTIGDGGFVGVGADCTIYDGSFINMTAGGMLAIKANADDSLIDFMELVKGSDAIRYWDYSIADWANITEATYVEDYTLAYLSEGDLAGYTVLTVGVPQPSIVGDANCDGVVDGGDAAVLARYWQTEEGAVWGMGDFNRDNAVNDLDATLLAVNWGNGPDGSVPEPSALAGLLGLAGFCILARRRRENIKIMR